MQADPISKDRLRITEEILAGGITEKLYTHAVYVLARNGQRMAGNAFGAASADTIFDLASLTKPTATATSILQLAEQGKIHLRQSVSRFFEDEFGPLPHLAGMEVRHLLTHTSGLPPIPRWPKEGSNASRTEMIRSVLTTPTLRPPEVGFTYSDTGYIVLGELVARASGQTLDTYFQKRIGEPLGLKNTGFLPQPDVHARLASTGAEVPTGAVHDPRARDLGGVSGHAGLFGTADDLLTYLETIRKGGTPILSQAAVARMAISQILPTVGGQSYGWYCTGNDYLPSGDFFSDRAFGHSGFTGTVLLIDPEYDVSLVLLTNRTVNAEEDGSRFLRLRRLWLNAMAATLL